MATQAERRAATRARLLETARVYFAQHGFDETHTNDIVAEAGLSRGAMYHHFESKRALFEAVFLEVSSEAVAYAIEQGGEKEGALEALLESCFAWLQTVRQAEVASILIDQGPRVLGWERARELEGKTSYRPMRKSLERAVAEGAIRVESVPLATRFINAMLTEAAMELLYSESRVSKRKTELMLRQFIEGLRA